ncbi:unnamed protein product [Lampetra fluviatilis]
MSPVSVAPPSTGTGQTTFSCPAWRWERRVRQVQPGQRSRGPRCNKTKILQQCGKFVARVCRRLVDSCPQVTTGGRELFNKGKPTSESRDVPRRRRLIFNFGRLHAPRRQQNGGQCTGCAVEFPACCEMAAESKSMSGIAAPTVTSGTAAWSSSVRQPCASQRVASGDGEASSAQMVPCSTGSVSPTSSRAVGGTSSSSSLSHVLPTRSQEVRGRDPTWSQEVTGRDPTRSQEVTGRDPTRSQELRGRDPT